MQLAFRHDRMIASGCRDDAEPRYYHDDMGHLTAAATNPQLCPVGAHVKQDLPAFASVNYAG